MALYCVRQKSIQIALSYFGKLRADGYERAGTWGEGEVYIGCLHRVNMSDSLDAEIAFKCDLCGELFDSPIDAQSHSRKAHAEPGPTGEEESQVKGTSAPAEDNHD